MVRGWLAWIGIANGVALVAAAAYILFVLPGKAVEQVASQVGSQITETVSGLDKRLNEAFEKFGGAVERLGKLEESAKTVETNITKIRATITGITEDKALKVVELIQKIEQSGISSEVTGTLASHEQRLKVVEVLAGAVFYNDKHRQTIVFGATPAGATSWDQYEPKTLRVRIETSAAGFSNTPIYFTSLGGAGNHFVATGATNIYDATATGFTVYINMPYDVTPQFANDNRWNVQWVAIGE